MSGTARKMVPIDVVVGGLTAAIEALCAELLPDGRRQGAEWVAPSRWGGSRRSLSVHLTGSKAGVWKDFAADKGGDALDLVAELLCGGDKKAGFGWSRAWLGLEGASAEDLHRRGLQARVDADARAAQGREEAERRRRSAQALWLRGQPAMGSPVEAYLAARGILLAEMARPPSALRYVPDCWCEEAGQKLRAMVAVIGDAEGRYLATHRTWLAELPDDDGVLTWRKARLRDAKKSLGAFAGGFIRLSRGASGKPWRERRGDEVVAVAEGIETALSVALAVPEWRVISAVSLDNMANLDLPKSVREVVVCADNDAPNSAAVKVLGKVVNTLLHKGCRVRVARPEDGVKDWNDALRAERP